MTTLYPWLKSLHLAAVMIWMGGMVVLVVARGWVASAAVPRPAQAQGAIEAMRAWDRQVTLPAMGLTWALGILIAVQGSWFSSPWLSVKLILVLALSGLHGMLSGSMRRLAEDPSARPPAVSRFAAAFVLASITVIAILVIVKPF